MVTEMLQFPVKRPRLEPYYYSMDSTGRNESPTPDRVSSAADAMLRLSNSTPNLPVFVMNPNLRSALTGGLSPIGQPRVAYMAQPSKDGAQVNQKSPPGAVHPSHAATHPFPVAMHQSKETVLQPPAGIHQSPVAMNLQQALQHEAMDVKPDIKLLTGSQLLRAQRKQREFIPEYKKDDHYWTKRKKNNEAAKRSREKRRMNDMAMGEAISGVKRQKDLLYRELRAIKRQFGLPLDQTFPFEDEPSCYSSSNSVGDDSGNESSQVSLCLGSDSNNTNTPVFPSATFQDQTSALKKVLSAPSKAAVEKAVPVASLGPMAPSNGATTAIPFLIPVSGTSQSLALVANIGQASFPINPALLSSLAIPTQSLLAQNSAPELRQDSLCSTGSDTQDHKVPVGLINGTQNTNAEVNHQNTESPVRIKMSPREISQPLSPDSSSRGSLHIVCPSSSASDYSECDTSDEHDGRRVPLNLCKKENDGAAQGYIEIKPISPPNGGGSHNASKAAIPHKLRHKLANYLKERGAYSEDNSDNGSTAPQSMEAEASNGDELVDGLYDSSSDGGTDSPHMMAKGNTSIDPKYIERRRRNNAAARKCREQRKVATDQRVAKSSVLESENERLKLELQNLTSEVSTLKELIELKHAAKVQGKAFQPPAEDSSDKETSNDK